MSEKEQAEELRRIENEKRVRNLFELIPCQLWLKLQIYIDIFYKLKTIYPEKFQSYKL